MQIEETISNFHAACDEMMKTYAYYTALGIKDKEREQYRECAAENAQLAKWLEELIELRKLAQFVTKEVMGDNFKENADCFAELVCRKLANLGYVKLEESTYRWEDKCSEDNQ